MNYLYDVICDECTDSNGLIFDDKNKSSKALEIFNICLSCRCCTRHQINKPTTWSEYFDYNNNLSIYEHTSCNCNCRHLARMICRKHPNSTT